MSDYIDMYYYNSGIFKCRSSFGRVLNLPVIHLPKNKRTIIDYIDQLINSMTYDAYVDRMKNE